MLLLTVLLFSCAGIFAQTITTSPITITTKCGGDTVKVSYTITGTFTAGNIFTAQLSDAAGAFTAPVNIGTLTAVVAGSITATIPSATASGTGYKVRVVSNTPAITGTTSTSTLIINAIPAVPAVTPAARCATGVVTLSATPGGANEVIKWYSAATAGTLLTTANSYTTPSIAASTNYYALDSNTVTKCVASSRVAVLATVNALPAAATLAVGGNTPCGGGSATISATPAASCSLNWYAASTGGSVLANGVGVTSFNTPAITATTIYYALDSNTVTTCVAASRLAVTATKLDSTTKPAIIWARSATTRICSGVGNDTLKVTPVTGVTYQWYKVINGANVALANVAPYTGVATNQLVLTTPNDSAAGNPFYVVAKKTTSGCTINSDNQTIVINPAPTVSIGSVSDNLGNLCDLNTSISFTAFPSTTSGVTYQWYKNAVLVTGATASSYSQSSWVSNDDIKCIIAVAAPGCAVSSSATSNSLTVTSENTSAGTWTVKSSLFNSAVAAVTAAYGVSFSIGNKGYLAVPTIGGVLSQTLWEFDPFLNSWTQKANFPGVARTGAVGFAIGNYGYVGGGTNSQSIANNIYYADYYKYYPPTNSWTQVADQPIFGATPSPAPYGFTPCGGTVANPNLSMSCATPVYGAASFSIGNKGYLVGGDAGYYLAFNPRKETWIYDPTVGALGTWTRGNDYGLSDISGASPSQTIQMSSFVIGDNAYVGQGTQGSNAVTVVWKKYNATSGTWSDIATSGYSANGTGVGWTSTFAIGSYGYICGGYNNANGLAPFYSTAKKYDPVANAWTAIASLPAASYLNGFAIGGKGYALNSASSTQTYELSITGLSIKTGPIANTSLCLGSTFNVPYTLGCNATTNFAGDFIVQLSDSIGTFKNPIEIGRAAATNGAGTSGSISATIPTDSKLSNQYRIRIVSESSSSPATNTIGYMNDALVTVGTVPTGGTIGIDHTVPYPAELSSDAINNVTLPNTSVIALSSTNPYTWQKTTNTTSGTWTNIANANGANYNLPLTAQVDTFYRRLANFACLASVPSNVVGIKVFSSANNKLNGSISGMVKTRELTGVADINITIQKTSGSLLGSPITKVYTTTTGNDGKYIIPNIFYGDINNGDPTSVTYLVKAFKTNHDIQNSNGVSVTLSNTNPSAINIDFIDNSALSIKGAVTTSMEGVNGGAMDSVNFIKIQSTRINTSQDEKNDTTGSQGYGKWAITVIDQIPYRFTPVYKNHKFIPAYQDINVTSNYSNIDFYDSTFNTISGVFRASGGSEIIGRAVIKFEDTVKNRPGVKFTKTITTNTDGSYSVTLPARKYKATVMSFIPANNQTNDINSTELLEFFNIRQKDSSIIDIDTMNVTKNFIYHRKPVLTFQNLPDSCGKKVFRQNQSKKFIVNIWEGDPVYNYKVVTDSTDSLRLVTNVAGDVNLDTTYYSQRNGSDTITLVGGNPNNFAFDNYAKTLKLDYKDKWKRYAAQLSPTTVVLGLKTNRGTFVTVSPQVPLLILHAPPGDQSSSMWEQNNTTETEMSFTYGLANSESNSASVTVGLEAVTGIGFATITEVEATLTGTLSTTATVNGSHTAVYSTSTTTSYETEPGGGDVYVGAALNLKYAVADELMFNDTVGHACEMFNKSRFVVAPNGFATTYTYSEGQITDVIVPTLQAMADNAPTVPEQRRYLNQVNVWNQVVEYNRRNKARASFVRNRSFDGNAGPITESVTESSSSNNTIEFGLEIEASVAAEVEAKVAGVGVGGSKEISMTMSIGGSVSTTNTSETTIGYTLDDDDAGDYFSVDIKRDPVYKTPVFEMVAGTSSCPAEEIAQNRDAGRLDIPEEANGAPNKVQTNIPATNEAIYQLKLRNISESRETRTYNLEFDQSSNPNGAIVTIGGNPSNVPVSYTIPYLGTQIVTVTVKKNAYSNVYSYEGLRFVMTDACGVDEEDVSDNTLSAYFASPCSNITLVSPTDGWLSNTSGNNMIPISFNGYNINNLQSVTLQYAHTGRGDWLPGFVLNQSDISNTGTQNTNWDITNVEDGNYEIRLMLQCVNGTVFSTRYSGLIDRKAPQLYGTPQPADHILSIGDDISFTFDENILTSGLNNNKVKLTKVNNAAEIPVQVTGYGNKVNIVPTSDLFANYYGDSLRVVIKNIADLNGNIQTASDTIVFLVGGSTTPIASNVKVKRVSISNVNPTKTSVFENSGDSMMVKFKFDTTSNTTSRTLVRYIVGGSAQYNSGYTVSYSNGQSLATVYNGTEGSITIPAYQDSAILTIKPIADAINELDETVTLSLISGGDYTISDKYLIKDTIKNDDNLGTPVITSSGNLCQGGSITLTTPNTINGQAITSYEWRMGGVIVGTTQTITVRTSGNYTVSVYNASLFSGTSNVFTVNASAPPTSTLNVTICSNQAPYSWNGGSYAVTGTYSKNISNANGCDSTAILNLRVNATSTSTSTVSICSSQLPYAWNNTNYTQAGTYNKTFNNALGCDSIATLILSIKANSSSSVTAAVCSNQLPYVWNGTSYYSTGSYSKVYTNTVGCDSVVTLNLTVKSTVVNTSSIAVCSNQMPYIWNSMIITTPGTYTKTLSNAVGCDSSVVLVLSVKSTSSSVETISAIDTYTWHGTTYNTSTNTPTWTGVNAVGCDSVVTLNLTITPTCNPISVTSNVSSCNSYTWHGITIFASTTLQWTGKNARGCDSTEIINITINQPTSSTTNTGVCSNQLPYIWNGTSYSTAGTYVKHLLNAKGCDSAATLVMTIKLPTSNTVNNTICSSQLPYLWNGLTCNTSGTYLKTLTNAVGCDSTVTLNLTVKQSTTSSTNISVCSNQLPIIWNGITCSNEGQYMKTLNNSVGCDSVAYLILKVKRTSSSTEYINSNGPYTWHGILFTSSNNSTTWTTTNAEGCDSVVTLNLTISNNCTPTSSTQNVTACGSYTWHGMTYYSSMNNIVWTGVNVAGCDSVVTLNLTITQSIPALPASITQTLVSNACGARVYRFTAAASANAAGYQWILPITLGGVSGVSVDSGDVNSSIAIKVKFLSNLAAATTDSIWVRALSGCGNTNYKSLKLNNALLLPATPASITITAISTTICGAKRYRYTAPTLTAATTTAVAATGYLWSFTGTLGANAVIDSGNVNSKIITVTYSSNAAAVIGDSVLLYYTSSCGNSDSKAAKLTNTALAVPAAPSTLTSTLISDLCTYKRYRYAAPALISGATGYQWSFIGTLGANAVIDSGSLSSQIITVTFTNMSAAATGDSVKVAYNSNCGLSLYKAAKLTNVAMVLPSVPASITITPISTTICGAKIYRYTAPALPVATSTIYAATGYVWSFVGTLGANAVIDSGSVNSSVIRVTYTNDAAAATGDSVKLYYTSICGNSPTKAAKLTNTLLTKPAAPASVTITIVSDVCGARVYRYAAPALPAATTTAVAATGYVWSMPIGTLGTNGVLDSGSVNSQVIRIRYSSNVAATTGDSIKVLYTSVCGNTANKAQKLSNAALVTPSTPSTLTGLTNVCSLVGSGVGTTYTVSASTNATTYLWTIPSGAFIDSGSNGLKVRIVYTTVGANDSIIVQGVSANGCLSAKKVLKLTTAGCATPVTIFARNETPAVAPKSIPQPMSVNVYPNPTTSSYNMYVKIPLASKIIKARVMDIQGRMIKEFTFNSDQTISFGNELISGIYMVELREGDEVKTVRVVKY